MHNSYLLIAVLTIFSIFTSTAQTKTEIADTDPVLFTFGEDVVRKSAFEYVYHKNNQNDDNAYTAESLEEYLRLYINFRLKVKEAEAIGLDTVKVLMNELETYRKQLAKSYLYDREVNEKLVREAYDRMKGEVNASHILIKIKEPGLPADTLEAYKKSLAIRKRIKKGESFSKLAKEYSGDPSAKTNNGNIGWFTVFSTIYPFETAAYNLNEGDVSMPVRTVFGYHVIRIEGKREARGTIQVAHILIKTKKNAGNDEIAIAKEKAYLIYDSLKVGYSFNKMVTDYSQDRFSSKKGGLIPSFSTGKMVEVFEDAAFAIEKNGEISEPVKSDFGWHIIKRIKLTPIASFDDVESELRMKIERDSRSQVAKDVLVNQIKKEYNFRSYSKNKTELFNRIGEQLTVGRFNLEDKSNLDKTLFKIADKTYTQLNFVEYLEKKQKSRRNEGSLTLFNDYFNKYSEEMLLAFEEAQLEDKYPDFKALMREYRDGILLFDLTDKKVWSKAVQDTVGLKAFHEGIKTKYMWDTRIEYNIYTIDNEKAAKKAYKYLYKKGYTKDKVLVSLNTEEAPKTINVNAGLYEKGDNEIADALEWKVGVKPFTETKKGWYELVNVIAVHNPEPKLLIEAKGFIVSDYQEYLEKEWIEEMRVKYPVNINTSVLESLVKK